MRFVRGVVAGLLAVVIGGQALAQPSSQQATRSQMEEGFAELPVFRSMRDHHPQVFRKIVDEATVGLLAGDTRQELVARVRPIYLELVASELPKASDENLLGAMRVTLAQMRALQTSSPDACYALAIGDQESNFAGEVPEALIAEEQAWAAKLFTQTATAPVVRQPGDDSERIGDLAMAAYEALPRPDRARFMELGGDLVKATSADDRRIGCAFGVAMFELLLEMPQREAVGLFYALMVAPEP